MPTLQMQLFNHFQLSCHGTLLSTVYQPRIQALLVYLVLHRDVPQSRRQLAFLFWPDTSEAQAHTNLRQLLHHLRRAWPDVDEFLQIDAKTLQWKPAVAFDLDVVAFEQAVARAAAAMHSAHFVAARTALAEAVDLYCGELLPNCYEDWLLTERERLHQHFLDALAQLMMLCESQRDYPLAIQHAQRFLRADPLHETTYRRLMRLHALNDDRASALRTYHNCADMLERELGVQPNQDTQAAYARLLKLEIPVAADPGPPARSAREERLVGRQSAWKTLQTAWQATLRGHAHFVCIRGEAGIGKTRLAEELLNWTRQQGIGQARARSYAAEGSLAYAPVTEWLRAEVFQQARRQLPNVWLSELARLLPEILVERPDLPHPEPLTERWQRQRFFEALAHTILAGGQPLLLMLDDLQWCDQETLEWLAYLLRFDAGARLLLIGTVRPEELDNEHPLLPLCLNLRTTEQLTELDLTPLDEMETAALACQAANQTLAPGWLATVYQATEGNPLFVVETVRASLSQPTAALAEKVALADLTPITALPPKIHAVIQSRLRQLSPPARALAQLAATIGRAFTFEALAAASGSDEEALASGLDELWQRRIVRVQDANTYDFSHDRIRDVAYAEISPARRRLLHQRVAQALEKIYADQLDQVCGQLAAHYEQAGFAKLAIAYYEQATSVAQALHAYPDLIVYLNKRLALLAALPMTAESGEQKVDTLLQLGSALIIMKGYTAPELEAIYGEARALCQQIEDIEKRFLVARGLRIYWGQRCDLQIAAELDVEVLRLARQTQNPIHLQIALRMTGATLFHRGKFKAAHDYLRQAVALYTIHQHSAHSFIYDHDPAVAVLFRLAPTLWLLGYPDQAQARIEDALAMARLLALPFNIIITLDFACNLAHYLRRPQAAQVWVAEMGSLTAKHPFANFVASEMIYHGWVLAEQGEPAAGIVLLNQGLAALREMGTLLFVADHSSLLIEAYRHAKQFAQGLALVTEILALIETTGDCYWRAELHRLQGELLLAQNAPANKVEDCYWQALEIARQQDAKSLELRAALSLARLWQQQAKRNEARRLLAEIYGWFTEGFETADLQAAKTLLEELKH